MGEAPKDGGPAFPITAGQQVYATGITMRDWFATEAPPVPHWWMEGETQRLQPPGWHDGMQASDWNRLWNEFHMRRSATWAFHYADAMLEARK